jgi:AP-2 complex subunit alpha
MWKLLYTRMLGYDVEFGHKQAMDLLASTSYPLKHVGYVACSIFLTEKDELLRLVINSVRNDLISRNESFQSLALDFAANVGGEEFSQLLMQDVVQVLGNGATRPAIRKKASLCLLRLIRKFPEDHEAMPADVWGTQLASLLEDSDPGVCLGLVTLLLGIVSRGSYEGFEPCVTPLVNILERMRNREVPQDYTYYGIASPWLQVKCLRTLQYFPTPTDPHVVKSLVETVKRILGAGGDIIKNQNKSNAIHAIVFEAVAVAVALEDHAELLPIATAILAKFLTAKEANMRYVTLENMSRLAEVPAVAAALIPHQQTITACLKDPDASIKRQALDLLFICAGSSNAVAIVEELLGALSTADYDSREDIVLKAAVLAERFLPSLEWYVDSMLTLMDRTGDTGANDIWISVVQLVTNAPSLHTYAPKKVIDTMKTRPGGSESFIRAACHIIGEYGRFVATTTPMLEQFTLLHSRFFAVGPETRAMMLTAYEKMTIADPQNDALRKQVANILDHHRNFMDPELQQRAIEYRALLNAGETTTGPDIAAVALQPLPKWEKQGSLLLRRLAQKAAEEGDEAREIPAWLSQLQEEGGGGEGGGEQQQHQTGEGGAVIGAIAAAAAAGDGDSGSRSQPDIAKRASPVPDLMDLLDLHETPPTGSGNISATAATSSISNPFGAPERQLSTSPSDGASSPGKQSQPSSALVASSSLGKGSGSIPQSSTTKPSSNIQPTVDLQQCARKLYLCNSGVLYEDANLQVGVKSTYASSTGQITLFLGNKHATSQLSGVLCKVMDPLPAGLHMVQTGPSPGVLTPKQQVQVPFSVSLLAPTNGSAVSPKIHLAYQITINNSGGASPVVVTMNQVLELPVPLTKFQQDPPVDIPAALFASRWSQVPGPPFKLEAALASSLLKRSSSEIEDILMGLNLRVVKGVQVEGPEVVCAACVVQCGGGGGQPMKQVPCMVKVERGVVGAATPDGMATEALMAVLMKVL